jgi:hypothetical protein
LFTLLHTETTTPPAHRTGPFLPTHQRTPDAPRSRSRLALDVIEGRCIDSPVRRRGAVSNEAKMGHFTQNNHSSCTQNRRAVPTHHRTPNAPRWRSRLALDALKVLLRCGFAEEGAGGIDEHLGHRLDHERQQRCRRNVHLCAFCCYSVGNYSVITYEVKGMVNKAIIVVNGRSVLFPLLLIRIIHHLVFLGNFCAFLSNFGSFSKVTLKALNSNYLNNTLKVTKQHPKVSKVTKSILFNYLKVTFCH